MTSAPPQTNLPSQSASSIAQGQTQATAATAPARGQFSYASATKRNATPNASESFNMASAVGIPPAQHGHSDSVNGRNITTPAIPSMNGNNGDHARKPSMTVTPAGATVNGGAVGGAQNKATGIQFGSVNAAGSAMGTPTAPANHHPNLSATSLNPRLESPHNSPSPIPQPATASGGPHPPSTIQAQGMPGMSFGNAIGQEGSDPNVSYFLHLCCNTR
jgi:translation initiation factor 4G